MEEKMKKFLKQLFCRHHYKEDGRHIETYKHFDYECYIVENAHYKDYVCTKCGKKKKVYQYSR